MKVTREVVTDLLPAYFSGEASGDTRALVEQFLNSDPDFSRTVKAEWGPDWKEKEKIPQVVHHGDEMAVLARSRQIVRLRSILMGFAIFFTCMIAGFRFDGKGAYWLWADFPQGAGLCAIAAAVCWIAFLVARNPLRKTPSR